jgi:hypothetical protein
MISGYINKNENIVVETTNMQESLMGHMGKGGGVVSPVIRQMYDQLRNQLNRDPYSLFGFVNNRRRGWPNTLSSEDASHWIEGMNNIANRYSSGVRSEIMLLSHLYAYNSRPNNTIRERTRLRDQMRRLNLPLTRITSNGINPDNQKIRNLIGLFTSLLQD